MELEKIIEGLECLTTKQHKCAGCPFNPHPGMDWPYGCGRGQVVAVRAAQAWLKELVPVAPILVREGWNKEHNNYRCPVCGADIYHGQGYCEDCGKGMKWDG